METKNEIAMPAQVSSLRPPTLRRSTPPPSPVRAFRQSIPKPPSHAGKTITIKRWAAVGDVIAASSVAKLLKGFGFTVNMVAAPGCQEALVHCPHIGSVSSTGAFDINLDWAYENHPEKKVRSIPELMIEQAAEQIRTRNVPLRAVNWANTLVVTPRELALMNEKMAPYPGPWVVVSPTSHRPARTVGPEVFVSISKYVRGTMFWASPAPSAEGLVNLGTKTIRELMTAIALADLAIVSESAPLHLAAGLKTPAIALRMSTDPVIRVSHQRDVLSWGRTDLSCLPCGEYICPIDADHPPCSFLDSTKLACVINARLDGIFKQTVSAIIPVYTPDKDRLTRCLEAVIPQVDEVVLALDGTAELPTGLPLAKVKVCRHKKPGRYGYGKTCNRGVLESSGRYLLFLNDDCYLAELAVKRMLSNMGPKTAVVGCQQRYPDGRIYFGGAARSAVGFGHIDHLQLRPTILNAAPAEFVNFACALVRREAFYEVDAFDERYDCYCEDADLCLRLTKAGWGLVYEPNALAVHEESQSMGTMKKHLMAEGVRVFHSIWLEHFRANRYRHVQIFA